VGSKTEDMKKIAGKFIGWATSKEMEINRVIDGKEAINLPRASTFESKEFKERLQPSISRR